MPQTPKSRDRESSEGGNFVTTHWSVVLAAGGNDSQKEFPALADLCRTYWYPLYAFARRTGYSPDDAKDVTQGFFAKLLEKHYLRDVDRERGRFRSFLLASFRHFMANERNRARAQKRGGGKVVVSFEAQDAETRYSVEPAHNVSAERIFERSWALTLLKQAIKRLRDEHVAGNKLQLFEELKGTLTGDSNIAPYATVSIRLGISEGATKVAAHRLRQRYRKLLRQEIAHTVATPDQIDDELRHLLSVFGD